MRGTSSHRGAGAHETTSMVRRLRSKACTRATASAHARSILSASRAAILPVSLSVTRFLPRSKSVAPKPSSTRPMARATVGTETNDARAASENEPSSATATSCSRSAVSMRMPFRNRYVRYGHHLI